MKKYSISLDPEQEKGGISRLLFGHNLEHTRSSVWKGISAQMIRNRKFAGKPSQITGQAMEWYAIGIDSARFLLDGKHAYTHHYQSKSMNRWNEIHCQRMFNPIEGHRCGIGQDRLAFFEGIEYEVRVALKGDGGIPVDITIKDSLGETIHFETVQALDEDWMLHVFTFISSKTDEDGRIEISFSRKGIANVGAVSLMPADNEWGLRKDVIKLLEEIGAPVLRWPGGNFAGDYRWQDGLLETDRRAPLNSFMENETLPHTGGFDFHEIGIDEFIALCRKVGAEPFISFNIAWDSPEECASWVEYCNGSADTVWGKLRMERGYAEPYRVKYWSLGNELGYSHMEGPNDPEEYASKVNDTVLAVKAADDSIILCSSGLWSNDEWFSKGLTQFGENVALISHHSYTPFDPQGHAPEGMEVWLGGESGDKAFLKLASMADRESEMIREIREKMNETLPNGANIGISFDEWNVWYAWYRRPGIVEGIYTASMLNMFCRDAERLGIEIGCFFEPVNEGAIIVREGNSFLTPMGQVMSLFKRHYDQRAIEVTPSLTDGILDAAGSLNQERSSLTLTVVNRSPVEAAEIIINADGSGILGKTSCTLLKADDYVLDAAFTEDHFTVEADQNNSLKLMLPKHSVIMLEIPLSV
ncbi:hypothetical protein [Paenibacillus sp. sgz302251]|uniref:hypothetical protein n=1 Tax=Paenibacillus sp. sgz302251 TaxID=3414493 RepID=UPI003C7C1A15